LDRKHEIVRKKSVLTTLKSERKKIEDPNESLSEKIREKKGTNTTSSS